VTAGDSAPGEAKGTRESDSSSVPTLVTAPAAREHARLSEIYTVENMMSDWRLRLLRAGAALLIVFEVLYFLFDRLIPPPTTHAVVAIHLAAIGVAGILLGLTSLQWAEDRFHAACFASLTIIYGLTLALCLIEHDAEPLFLTVVLSVLGAAGLAPWSTGWQTGIGAVGVLAVFVQSLAAPPGELGAIDRLAGVVAAILLGHFTLTMRGRHRAELAHWMARLRDNRRALAAALAHAAGALAEREASESRVRESERMLRRIFEACPDAITIKRQRDGRYVDVNHGFRVFGYSREEALGKTAEELGLWADPKQLQDFALRVQVHGHVRNMETLCRTRDGHIIPSLISASTVEIGGEPCVVSFVRDITHIKETEAELMEAREALARELAELKRTEKNLRTARAELGSEVRELRASRRQLLKEIADRERAQLRLHEQERTLRKILETSPDSMTIKRLEDGRYIEVNKVFEANCLSREEALGRTALELNLWADPAAYAAYCRKLDTEGRVRNMEFEYRARDGQIRPALVSSTVVELEGELCVVSFARDIGQFTQARNELIAAREAALAASEAKSHFLSVMSHEIRTPMNAILGMADLLWETPLSTEQRRYLDTVLSNGASLLKLVNNILDLSKIESGRLILEHADFDLIALAEDVVETMAVHAHEKGLDLALRIAPVLPTALTGDPLRLRQILINLIGNGIKFTERGEVVLTIEDGAPGSAAERLRRGHNGEGPHHDRQLVRFTISDTGIGIPAEKQGLIFSDFTQADSTITRKYGGSGLGLAIARRLVGLMNGSIALTSRSGAGCSFTFTVALEVQPRATNATQPGAPPAVLAGKRVLVVDSSPASRAMLADLLGLARIEAALVSSAAEAVAEILRAGAENRNYDACMVEFAIPDAARLMYAIETTKLQAMILMLTTRDLKAQLGQLRKSGLADGRNRRYLLKPVRRAELWDTLTALCAGEPAGAAHRNGSGFSGSPAYPGHDALLPPRAAARDTAMVLRRPLRILLAEDSPDSRLLIEAYLKHTPYQLDKAEDGKVAVDKFATGHWDVILMDIEMPVMDGYEAIAEIRRLERADHRRPTPIIALTASAQDEIARKSLKMGCEAHLIKPVKRAQVLEAIVKAVTPSAADESASPGGSAEPARAAASPIVIEIDADLSELVPGFLDRKRADARAILSALDQGDTETVARLAHKMKGEGGSYGFDAITDLGRGLEQAAKEGDLDTAGQLGSELTQFLERVEIVYRPAEE